LFNKISFLFQNRDKLCIVLSGGNTPKLFYKIFAEYYIQKIKWEYIHLFWSDERCVPPDNSESNFKMTKEYLLNLMSIPSDNIHRIIGENDPVFEAERYSNEILSNVKIKNNLPSFDITILGLGEDGHAASIFPGQLHLITSEKICESTIHPVTKQNRITLTGKVINNSDEIIFLVTGKAKSKVIKKIVNDEEGADSYPAYHICSTEGNTEWFLDNNAASLIL
jgi:6-phosphogluconolactonase